MYTFRAVNTLWREVVSIMEEEEKALWELCCPRRINVPGGYASPRFYAPTLYSQAHVFKDKGYENHRGHIPEVLAVSSCKLIQRGVPTYFIAPEFAEAVAHTRLPEGFTTAQIMWPLDAFLFVLPEAFSRAHFGCYIVFISVTHAEPGVYPQHALKPNQIEQLGIKTGHTLVNSIPRTIISGVMAPDNPDGTADGCTPADYSTDFPDTFMVSKLDNMPYEDLTSAGTPIPPKGDTDMASLIATFAVKLMLVLGSRSGLVKPASMARPQKVKKGRVVQTELWQAAVVGETYRISRKTTSSAGGTHASPRMHWRWGHYTHQFIGKRKGESYVPAADLPRRQNGSIDWDAVTLEQREAFWRNHKLVLIDPVLVNAPKDVAE